MPDGHHGSLVAAVAHDAAVARAQTGRRWGEEGTFTLAPTERDSPPWKPSGAAGPATLLVMAAV
jgi:hypothetical protein